MKVIKARALVLLVVGLLMNGVVCAAQTAPKVLLYHSFDAAIEKADYSTGPMEVSANKEFKTRTPAISGKAAWFTATDADASLQIDMKDLSKGDSWTVSLWEIIHVKEWLSAPHDNLITLLDADKKPIVKLSKSGDVFVYDGGKEIHQDCFDALYWVRRSREHLALTWDAAGSGVKAPAGILRAFWKARPYAALAIDIKRKPVYLEIGMATSGFGVDDLYVFDSALPLRTIWELMRWKNGKDIKGLEKMLAERGEIEAKRGTAARTADWAGKVKEGIIVEAESNPGESKVVVCPVPNPEGEARESAANNNAATASGRACVEPGSGNLTFKIQVEEAGEYALALRYCFGRKMHAMWPQNSTAKTPWTENYTEVEVRLDGKKKPIGRKPERLYPTGTFAGHTGDVEMWAWHALNRGKKVKLSAGEHTLTASFKKGLQRPVYDALLMSKEPGSPPPHPRWMDLYRVPPAWWVESHKTAMKRRKRIDTYEVILRNRCDEPCSYEIVAGPDRLERQTVGVRATAGDKVTPTCSVALKPFEQKSIEVVFETPAKLTGICEWANIYLWNDDVALRQKYLLWNLIPDPKAAAESHPRLIPAPDPKLQAEFRAWLKTRDEKALTPELRQWINGMRSTMKDICRGWSVGALESDRLKALDDWMKMSEAEIEQYLPDGPPESNGYGTGWDRVSIPYSGKWYVMPRLTKMEPEGDIDMVRSVTYEGDKPKEGAPKPYKRIYTAEKDSDVISCVRNVRFGSMLGDFQGTARYKDTALGLKRNTGIGLLVDAYYLTGDPAYAQKAFEMLKVMAWKYTGFTKHFFFVLRREDRNWWGARTDGRYQFKFGSRTYQPVGTKALDLMWDALTPEQRTIIEHNVVRWGIYETMAGPLWDTPGFFAAVNREDMPFLPMGVVLDDPEPQAELDFFFDLFKDVLHPDGLHICTLGSYASVGMYAEFMQKMEKSGFHVKDDPALKNLFHAQPSFIFSGGGFPNLGDGGGVNIQGLGAGYGCASAKHYAWGKKLLNGDSTFDDWPKLIKAAQNLGTTDKKMEGVRKQYLESGLPLDKLWPPVYIAPITGIAMLRNRVPAEPIDWVEVIFDYGKMIGRVHGHAAKLATVPSFNGQIVSMGYGYGAVGEAVGSFHTSGYAHNIVQADGKSQFSAISPVQIGELRESHSEKSIQWVDADSSRIYKKIYMRRTLFTTDFGIVDLYLCRADKQHQYDWMFHSFGVAGTDIKVKPVAKLADGGVLTFAVNPRSASTKKAVRVTWENAPITKPPKKASTALLHEKAFVRVHVVPSGETGVHLFGIPITENCGSEIDYLMLRRNAASTVFATVQEPWRESTAPKVKSLRPLPVKAGKESAADHEAYALEVTRTDGRREVFFVNYTKAPKTVGPVTTDAGVAFWKLDEKGAASEARHTQGAAFAIR